MARKLNNPKNRMFLLFFFIRKQHFKPLLDHFYPQILLTRQKKVFIMFHKKILYSLMLCCFSLSSYSGENDERKAESFGIVARTKDGRSKTKRGLGVISKTISRTKEESRTTEEKKLDEKTTRG